MRMSSSRSCERAIVHSDVGDNVTKARAAAQSLA
jgi:hypothetical protein